jgi:hypothetical protein
MSQQLAYVIVTPYTLYKSRTGGILTRLITRTGLDLVGVRMFAPSAELVKEYSETIVSAQDPQDRKVQELLKIYVQENLSPDHNTGRRRRVMMLLCVPWWAICVFNGAAVKPSVTPIAT